MNCVADRSGSYTRITGWNKSPNQRSSGVWRAYGTVVVVLTVLLLGASQVYADCSTTQQLPSDLLCAKYVDYAIPGDWLEQDIRGKDNLVKYVPIVQSDGHMLLTEPCPAREVRPLGDL